MKIFQRALAMVLALILSFAVLPLGTFASEPWIEVGSGTQSTPGSDPENPNPAIIVKVNVDKLVEILQSSGISSALIAEIQSGIVIDIPSLLNVITIEELLEIIPADALLSNIGLAKLIEELGDKVDVYFDLGAIVKDLTADELEAIVKKDDALTLIMDHYQNPENGGLKSLLEQLLSVKGDDVDGDHVPDNCPIKIHALANALEWTKACFNANIYEIDFEAYIDEGLVKMEDFLDCWPKDPEGNFVLNGILDPNTDIKFDEFVHAAEKDANADVVSYIRFHEMLEEHPELIEMIEGNTDRYLKETGKAQLEAWIKADAEAASESWGENDLNADALLAKLKADDPALTDPEAAQLIQDKDEKVIALIKADPEAYLAPATYAALRAGAVTEARVETLIQGNHVQVDLLRADAIEHEYLSSEDFNDYIRASEFLQEHMDFLIHNATLFLEEGVLTKIHSNINIEGLIHKIHFDEIIRREGLETILNCLNLDAVLEEMELEGKELVDYVDLPLAIEALGVDTLLNIINKSGKSVTDLVIIDEFVKVVNPEKLITQLSPEAMIEIMELETVKAAMPAIRKLILSEVLYDINELTLNGRVIAAEDENTVGGRLIIDINTILSELIRQLPKLEDIAALESNTLFAFDIGMKYVTEEDLPKTKNFGLEIVLDGDIEKLKNAAAKLDSLVSKYVYYEINPDFSIVLDLKIPAQVMSFYKEIVNSADLTDEERQMLLDLTVVSNDAEAIAKTMTLNHVVTLLKGLDGNAILDKLTQIGFVQSALQKVGIANADDMTVKEFVAALGDVVESNEMATKFANIVKDKFGINVSEVLGNQAIEELEDIVLANRSAIEGGFKKVKNYILTAIDRASALVPDVLDKPLEEMYQGNGRFELSTVLSKDGLNSQMLAEKLAGKLFGSEDPEFVEYISGFFPEELGLLFTVDMSMEIANFYRVTYHDIDSKPIYDVFMPAGMSVTTYSGYDPEGFRITGWRSATAEVTKVTGDMLLYPIFEDATYTTVQFNDANGNVLALLSKKIGDKLTAEDIARLAPTKAHDEPGYEKIWQYVLDGWYVNGDDTQTKVDFADLTVAEGMIFDPLFVKDYFDDRYGDMTHPVVGGYEISADGILADPDPDDDNDTVLVELPEALVGEDGASITISDPAQGVSVTIDAETLEQLASVGGDKVTFSYTPNEEFESGYYNQNNSVQYTFDFLVGNRQENYSKLLGTNEFAGTVSFTFEFETIEQIAQKQGTFVYHVDGDVRTLIDATVTDGVVSFEVPHFSDFVIANEYAVHHRFTSYNTSQTVNGRVTFKDDVHHLDGDYTFLPVGSVDFRVYDIDVDNYDIRRVYTNAGEYDGTNLTVLADSDDIVNEFTGTINVVDSEIFLTVETEYTEAFDVTFIFNRETYKTISVKYGYKLGEVIDEATLGTPDAYYDELGNARDRYEFVGWKTMDGTSYTIDELLNLVIEEDLTIIGKAEQAYTEYKVSFLNYDDGAVHEMWVREGETIAAGVINAIGAPVKPDSTDGNTKYTFAAWLDANGSVVNFDTTAINAPTVFKAGFDTFYKVTFTYDDGRPYLEIWLKAGDALSANDEYIAMIDPVKAVPENLEQYLFKYGFAGWKNGTADYDATAAVNAPLTLTAVFEKEFLIEELNPNVDVSAVFNGNTYTILVKDTFSGIKLPDVIGDYVAKYADARLIVAMTDAEETILYNLIVADATMLANLFAANETVSVSYYVSGSFTLGAYNEGNSKLFRVGFDCGENAYVLKAEDGLTIRLPFDFLDASYNGATVIYQRNGSDLNEIEATLVTQEVNGVKLVRFSPDSLASWLIVNKYGITDGGATHAPGDVPTPAPVISATVSGFNASKFYEAGAEVTVIPAGITAGYKVVGIYYVKADGTVVDLEKVTGTETLWKLIVPAEAITLKVSLAPIDYKINYFVQVDNNGTVSYVPVESYLYNKHELANSVGAILSDHEAILAGIVAADGLYIPAAYEIDGWIGFDEAMLGVTDLNVYLTFKPIEYTLNFVDPADEDGEVLLSVPFNTETAALGTIILPGKNGYTVACPELADFDIAAAITAMLAEGVTETTLELVYTPCSYTITYNEAEVNVTGVAIYGEEITVEVIEKEFHKATLTVVTVNGDKVSVRNGVFTMPAASVKITVSYTPTGNTTYYINNRPFEGAMIGDVVTFEVRFTNGYRVGSISECCKLVSSTNDGEMYVLVYSFEVTDGARVSYTIEEVAYDDKNILNGSEFEGDGLPVADDKNVTFKGWSADILGAISFATFGIEDASSLLWLWILLAVLVLAVIFAIIYKLFTLGKLKNNLITRFVAFIVSGFLAFCRLVARIGLAILRIFGKKEEDFDYTEDEEPAEEVAPEAEETATDAEESAEDEE